MGEGTSPHGDLAAVHQRLARLERERWVWRIGAGVVLIGLYLANWATASPGVVDEVRARKIALVDAQGKPQAVLDATGLTFFGPKGKPRVRLGEQGLIVADAEGQMRVALAVLPEGYPALLLGDGQKPRASLRLDKNPSLILSDPHGEERVRLFASDVGYGVMLLDPQRRPRASLVVGSDGRQGLGFFDAQGKEGVTLGIGADGSRGLILYDAQEKERVSLHIRSDGIQSLVMYGPQREEMVAVATDPDGSPMVRLRHLWGKSAAGAVHLLVGREGPAVALYDAQGRRRFMVGIEKDTGRSVLGFLGAQGEPRAIVAGDGLTLLDSRGAVRWKAP
jgi:hypothetical protein